LILSVLSSVYGAAASWRRRWYARDPARQHRLTKPVVSVGNLRVGGTGKTPVVAHLCELLLAHGERPAILTRGYRRTRPTDGVTIVSNGKQIIAGLASAGDEPLLLARLLPSVPILVGTDRFQCGQHAERDFDITVHVLDDGFQHLELARDVDLLLLAEEDLLDRPMPAGRLREGLDAATAADAALITAGYDTAAERIGRAFGIAPVFRVTRTIGAPRRIGAARDSVVVPSNSRVFVVTGIARPDRFTADILSVGWDICGAIEFRDHHRFTARDVRRIAAEAKATSAMIVLTTEKDAVRLAACDLGDLPIASVPLVTGVEPADGFQRWLLDRIEAGRQSAVGS